MTIASPPRHAGAALTVACLGFFLLTLDLLIVNLALPHLGAELGGGATGRQWVIDGYTLPFASLLLFGGNLADRAGAKRGLGAGIAVFLVASVGCAIAPTLPLLVAARAVQGIAAAVMLPASMSLLREAYPDARARARALGIWAVGGAIAATVGPALGGILTTIDWRLVFAINVPPCVLMLVLLARVARSTTERAPFSWGSQLLALVTLGALVGSLIEGGELGYGSPTIVGGFVIAVAAGIAFVRLQATSRRPMIPLAVFRPASMRIALALGFAFMVSNFGTSFLVSLYLQQQLGLSALQTGLLLLISPAFSIAANLLSGPVTNRFGARVPILIGMSCLAIGDLALAAAAPLGSPVLMAAMLILTGFGGAFAMPPSSGLVLASVPQSLAGTASAVFNTCRQIGGALAIAVFGALVADPHRFVAGMQLSLVVTAALVTAVVAITAANAGRLAAASTASDPGVASPAD